MRIKYILFLTALLFLLSQSAICQKKRITEDLTMVIPDGYTEVETSKNEIVYYGVNDTSSLIVISKPCNSDVDIEEGLTSKEIHTIDRQYYPEDNYQCIDSTSEKKWQWTYHYVKKTFQSSTGIYSYSFASRTADHMILIIYDSKSADNYSGLNSILTTLKYKPSFGMMIKQVFICADWRNYVLLIWGFLILILFCFDSIKKRWKIAAILLTFLLLLLTSGSHIIYAPIYFFIGILYFLWQLIQEIV